MGKDAEQENRERLQNQLRNFAKKKNISNNKMATLIFEFNHENDEDTEYAKSEKRFIELFKKQLTSTTVKTDVLSKYLDEILLSQDTKRASLPRTRGILSEKMYQRLQKISDGMNTDIEKDQKIWEDEHFG